MSVIAPLRKGDPARIGPYRILGRLGSGGMGTVFAATDAAGNKLAVKVVHHQQAEDPEFRARFHHEVEVLRRVEGPCLVPLMDADTTAEIPWLVTPFVPGLTLHQHVQTSGRLRGIQLHLFAAGCSSALAAIHEAGVIHRDLKPANVILSPQGPRVLDFGIAHTADGTAVTRTGVMTGTPGWISPEHYRDGRSGPAGDVFALGALIAYAATGRPPFGEGAADALAFRVMTGDPDLEDVPDALLEVVESALAKDPAHRPLASAMAQQTTSLLSRQPTQVLGDVHERPTQVAELMASEWHLPTFEDPAWGMPASRRRRTRATLAAVGAISVALTAAGVWTVQHDGGATSAMERTAPRASTLARPSRPSVSSPRTSATSAAPPMSVAASPSTAAPTATQLVTFMPWTPSGEPAQGITITTHSAGNCWEQAMGSGRDDAWRCSDDSSRILYDPCFASQNNAPHMNEMLCPADGSLTRLAWLVPDGPLPNKPSQDEPPTPLALVLEDHQSCFTAGGAGSILSTVNGQSLSYRCPHGDLYGGPNTSGSLWTITYRPSDAAESTTVPITKAYM
ncbi:protein kinase domain-containing protein [Streptomyces sp. NPDC004129]